MAPVRREAAADALENLIEQFSDVYSFYRELIQNSLDAGTNRVDVWLEFIPPEDNKDNEGVMIIHVDDYGEGMNREIVDSQLTRLFSSSKENDLTKIGKFGIGFVSVFAIKPDAVNIDTSRDGQDWRILFDRNKEFKRMRRDYPVEGTKIQIIKSCTEKFYNNFVKKSRETILFWCKHSEAEIYFNDELISKPFEVDSRLVVNKETNAGEVSAGYTISSEPFFGYYNQGLTLMEGEKKHYPNISFKIKSKYLEHTLTRDNIRQDENYLKAMELLDIIVKKDLPEKLFDEIESELMKSENETDQYRWLLQFSVNYLTGRQNIPAASRDKNFARDTEGGFLTVKQVMSLKNAKEIYTDSGSNPVTATLKKQGYRVIKTAKESALTDVLRILSGRTKGEENITRASDEFFIPMMLEPENLSELQKKMINAVDFINRKMGTKTEKMRFADFDYQNSCIKNRVYVMQKKPGELSRVSELNQRDNLFSSLFSIFSKTRTLILNRKHPYITSLMKLARTDGDMAAYFLAKLLYLDDGIDTETDAKLAELALERRG